MAKKRKGYKRGKPSIPVLPVAAAILPAYRAYKGAGGINAQLPDQLLWHYVGKTWDNKIDTKQLMAAAGPIIVASVAHVVANRVGINRYIRKATFGWLSL